MSIGTTIKKLRRDREMTQEVLAEYLGVSVSAVSQWEADKTSPDLSLIAPLCHLFSVSADILLEIDLAEKKEQIAAEVLKFMRMLRMQIKEMFISHLLMEQCVHPGLTQLLVPFL